jgi:hypothetical protein
MRRLWATTLGSWVLGNLFLTSLQAQPISYAPCRPLVTGFNTTQQGEVIVLGRRTDYRYVVVVPTPSQLTLNAVRQCVPDAFLTRSKLGPYVHAGAFPNRAGAESLSWFLRSRGINSRVVFFR